MSARLKMLLFAGGLSLIVIAWLSPAAVPIYDGIGAPDEPYRYVSPPPGAKPTAAPTPARAELKPSDLAASGGLSIASLESGPQINIVLGRDSISLPGQASDIEILAKPLEPADQPTGGNIEGNVYDLTVIVDGKAGKINLRSAAHDRLIDLRLPQGFAPLPAMAYKPAGGKWQKLDTSRVGNDIYESSLQGTGQYALARFGANAQSSGAAAVIAPLAALAVVAVIIAVIRFNLGAKFNSRKRSK